MCLQSCESLDAYANMLAPVQGLQPSNPFANFSEILKTAKEAQAKAGVEAAKAQEELSG